MSEAPIPIRILTVSGSLRSASSNSRLLRAAVALAPAGVQLVAYDGLASLPFFSPDLDRDPLPAPVAELRAAVRDARAVIISSPEYAHGVPGVLKNALDWLVSGFEVPGRPFTLWNPSPSSRFAQPSLAETLRTMSAALVDEACITVPLAGRDLDEPGIVSTPDIAGPMRAALELLAEKARATRPTMDLLAAG